MAVKNTIEHPINPSHLMYQAVRSHPLINISELDALIFSGLCLFVDDHGVIRLSEEDRAYLCQSLSVSPQQMSNTIARLKKKCVLYDVHTTRRYGEGTTTPGHYRLDAQLLGLASVPKKMTKAFTIRYIPETETQTQQYGQQPINQFDRPDGKADDIRREGSGPDLQSQQTP